MGDNSGGNGRRYPQAEINLSGIFYPTFGIIRLDLHQFHFIIILCLLVIFWIRQLVVIRISIKSGPKLKTPRPLKPKTADDCPFCKAEKDKQDDPLSEQQTLKPWSEVKSSRGRKKTHSTQGYACPNQDCNYFGIVDEHIHALVGYGRHGKTDNIQYLRCQACGRKFSVRWGTALYRLKTSAAKVALILALMAEGMDVSALERVFETKEGTLRTWLTRAGLQADKVHRHFFHHLILHHIQLDELPTALNVFGSVGQYASGKPGNVGMGSDRCQQQTGTSVENGTAHLRTGLWGGP